MTICYHIAPCGATVTAFLNKCVFLFFDATHIQRLDSSLVLRLLEVSFGKECHEYLWKKIIPFLLCNVLYIRIHHEGSSLLVIFFLHIDICEVSLS